jgi:hypothetical protein
MNIIIKKFKVPHSCKIIKSQLLFLLLVVVKLKLCRDV